MTEVKSVMHTGAELVQNQKDKPVAVSSDGPCGQQLFLSSTMEIQNHLPQEVSDPSRICIPNLYC